MSTERNSSDHDRRLRLDVQGGVPPGPVLSTQYSVLGTSGLIDTFGRVHNNLRISVTDRCNLRCTYCMPEDVTFLAKEHLLRFEEIVRFVRVAVPLGIDK